jgi:hypothetical protein
MNTLTKIISFIVWFFLGIAVLIAAFLLGVLNIFKKDGFLDRKRGQKAYKRN